MEKLFFGRVLPLPFTNVRQHRADRVIRPFGYDLVVFKFCRDGSEVFISIAVVGFAATPVLKTILAAQWNHGAIEPAECAFDFFVIRAEPNLQILRKPLLFGLLQHEPGNELASASSESIRLRLLW